MLVVCLAFPAFANCSSISKPYFAFSTGASQAYQKAIELRFVEARTLLAQLKHSEPDNHLIYLVENYVDFFTIFLDENEQEFRSLEHNKDKRLELIAQGDRNSPYFLYAQAEIKLQWALSRLKFEEYFSALMEIRSAYKLLTKNQKRFPNFVANKKSLGILHALVGTIPDSYRWGVKLLGGMDGTIEQGRGEIEEVLDHAKDHPFIFEEETRVIYALLMLHLGNQQETAWQVISSPKLNPQKNPLATFVLANVAMHSGKNEEVIRLLENRPLDPAFHPFPYLDYMLGLAKLYRLDVDADQYFKKYLTNFRGRNYIKEAYQKLAWWSLLQGNAGEYRRFIKQCKQKGAAVIGGDKQALKEATSGVMPDPILLRARLLFDGGYHRRALEQLRSHSVDQFATIGQQLEYTYRLGRITHRMGQWADAIEFYGQTIEKGREYKFYFACNAALQMGLVYEQQGKRELARQSYKECLRLRPDEYQNSLHQKAKAGLNRLDN
ncbi:MAG: tetratricopeptide repeat protein [Bacteroidota bacterium]